MHEPSSATSAETDVPFWKSAKGRDVCLDLKGPGLYAQLPSYGQAYMNQLIGEFKALKDVCANDKAAELAKELVIRAEAGDTMTWGDAYMLDTAIAQMLPEEYLHQRAWCLEVKYRDAVGNADAYDAFMKIEAPHLTEEKEEHLRARVHNIIRELYRLYTVISCREDMRERLSKSAMKTLVIVVALMIAIWGADHFLGTLRYFDVWCMVFTAGATGGLLSLQRRLQGLPSHGESLSDLVELSGRMTVRFTPVIGGIFAVVLFLLFASGLASGTLFPNLDSQTTAIDLRSFMASLQPTTTVDWGKLLVWSFIAGFAERLVPDTLNRLVAKSESSKQRLN